VSTLRSLYRRWGALGGLVLGALLLVPMSRHAGTEFVLCVEENGTVNVERARSGECATPARAEREHDHAQSALHPSDTEHCTACTDVPLTLAEAHEPCESAVLSPVALGDLVPERGASAVQDLSAKDRFAAAEAVQALRPRAPDASPASFRRREGHLFSDTSIVRAQSSVELLI